VAKKLSVAEAKRRFSELVGEVVYRGRRFVIERKGKPVVAVVPLEDLRKLEESGRPDRPRGLLAAVGAWEGYPDLDGLVERIYRARRKARDRRGPRLR
jgi:prevent-host-death family protein